MNTPPKIITRLETEQAKEIAKLRALMRQVRDNKGTFGWPVLGVKK